MTRTYYVIPKTEVDKIEIDKTCFKTIDQCPTSLDKTKYIIKWDGEDPEFVSLVQGGVKYNHKQIFDLMKTDEWLEEKDPIGEE